jgi:hypothetical protein
MALNVVRLLTLDVSGRPENPPEDLWILPLISKENQVGQPVRVCEISHMVSGDVYVGFKVI